MTLMQKIHYRITYGGHVISYELEQRERKTLQIDVYPDLTIRVLAPNGKSLDEIKAKVLKRASWILDQIRFFSLNMPQQAPKRYFSGETHTYLGKSYRLRIQESTDETVVLHRGKFVVSSRDRHDSNRIKILLNRWYAEKARLQFKQRLLKCHTKLEKYGIPLPGYQIRSMRTRWGSCTQKGKLTLNLHLIKAPTHCIEYVITHELCHLKYFNHGKQFYTLMSKVMPDWEMRKERLEQVIV